nr:uncharacterized protein LOC112005708 [Quercus suber]
MNLLVWNCRGLGNLRTKKELGNIIREKDPSVMFLAETWADEARLDRVLHNINFDHKWEERGRTGDSNSKFFHNKATQRFRKNSILGIKDRSGNWQEQPDLIGDIIVDFFGELFTICNPAMVDDSLSLFPQLVTYEINEQLAGDFMGWEVQEALKQIVPLKAPGPDGMPPLFYQHFWGLMDQEVTSTILTWLNSGGAFGQGRSSLISSTYTDGYWRMGSPLSYLLSKFGVFGTREINPDYINLAASLRT